MRTLRPNFIVGIGGSAGGLNAYKEFFDALTPDTGMAFVVISHLLPTAHSQLASILSRHTKMPVLVARRTMPIRANHAYVISPDEDLLMANDAFEIVSPRSAGNKQIDLFLISLADAIGPRAIGIVLSGYCGDGTEGCRQIKAKGGTTFAQDLSAEVGDMPLRAQASGCIDFVLPPDRIARELDRMAGPAKQRRG